MLSVFFPGKGFTQTGNAAKVRANSKIDHKMKVEIWSDVVCPFCYIGKRNFEAALGRFADRQNIEIEWKSFQLDPTVPREKVDVPMTQYLAERKGYSAAQVQQMFAQVTQTAKHAGLEYQLDKTRPLNTFDLHRVIQMAKSKGLGDHAEEAFFKAYFTDIKDLNDEAVVLTLAKEIGLSEADVQTALSDATFSDQVNADIKEAGQIGVNGVPFFVFDRKYAVSGAQPPETFLSTLEKAFTEWRSDETEIRLEASGGPACAPDGACE